MEDTTYEGYSESNKIISSSHGELKGKSRGQAGGKKGWRSKLQNIREPVTRVFAQLSFPLRKQGKKERRFIPVALLLYFLIFLLTSLFSLIGGTSASASSQLASDDPKIDIGGLMGYPSMLLDCTASTTTTTNSDGSATSTVGDGKYIPGGSPMPTCQSGHWSCPQDDKNDSHSVPVDITGNGKQDYVICLYAASLSNPHFNPTRVDISAFDTCDVSKLNVHPWVDRVEVDSAHGTVKPTCAQVAGVAGSSIWICPSNYSAKYNPDGTTTANYGGSTTNQYDTLRCESNNSNWVFPCSDLSDGLPAVSVIQTDWLSGNPPGVLSSTQATPAAGEGGRFLYTFPEDTFKFDGVTKLMPYTLGIGLILLTPVIVLIGYQVLLGSITFRYANALQAIPRLFLGLAIIVIAFTMTETLIAISNNITGGLVLLHKDLGFPAATVNGQPVAYTLANENDPISYRGMVVPMSRWGCAANEFVAILAKKFITDVLASIIPIFGNLVHLVVTITTFFEFIQHLGQFILLVLSIMLWAQVLVRIIILNYYILLCPVAFGCWALPGGFGQSVVNQWTKGFFSALLVQIVQVFIITTLPLVIPTLPAIPSDSLGLMKGILTELPPILVLWMTVRAPSILGTSTARAITNAGSIAGGVVTAVGATAYNMV